MTTLTHPPQDVADRPVVEVMSQPVYAVHATTTLDQALRAMLVAEVRHLVAVADEGYVVGVLSDRQIAATWARDPDALAVLPAAAVLDSCPPIVSRTATLRTVARVMRDFRTDVVVVVDNGEPIGVVTAGDVVAVVARPDPTD